MIARGRRPTPTPPTAGRRRRTHAHARLARMLCGDAETVTRTAAVALGEAAGVSSSSRCSTGRRGGSPRRHGPPRTLILGGRASSWRERRSREFDGPVVSLGERLGPERSAAACGTRWRCCCWKPPDVTPRPESARGALERSPRRLGSRRHDRRDDDSSRRRQSRRQSVRPARPRAAVVPLARRTRPARSAPRPRRRPGRGRDPHARPHAHSRRGGGPLAGAARWR